MTDGHEQLAANKEEPMLTQAGLHDLAVDHVPLTTGWDAGRRDVELRRESAGCMVIEPRKGSWLLTILVVLGLCAANIVAVVFLVLPGFDRNAAWGLRVLSVFSAAFFVALLLFFVRALGSTRRWIRFDRSTGLFTISRRPFLRIWRPLIVVRSLPLKTLLGVQLVDCGLQDYSLEVGEPGTPGSVVSGKSHGYQLNLIVDDKTEQRLNIARHSDGAWMQEAGRHLAEFLNVRFYSD
jgi:hypothetical protein